MKIATAVLISRVVPGWPDQVIAEHVPLGTAYRIDLDSERVAMLANADHPEWGQRSILAVLDVDDGCPLPVCCLRIES